MSELHDSFFAAAALRDLSGDQLYRLVQAWAARRSPGQSVFSSSLFSFPDGWWTPFMGGVWLRSERIPTWKVPDAPC